MPVLEDVSLTIRGNEIVSLLDDPVPVNRRCFASWRGLSRPAAGKRATLDGQGVEGPAEGVSMVFQTFALLPWLTVLENVEFGLEAKGVARAERRQRAGVAIDLIGLGGFESAYPKELSGGMRQRVGFARALVTHPKLL